MATSISTGHSMTSQTKATLYAALTILAWSTVSTAFKLSLQVMSPMQLIYVSMGTAALVLALWLSLQKNWGQFRQFNSKDWFNVGLLGVMIYGYYVLLFFAYDRLPAQITQPINNTWAIMLTLFAVVFFKQRFNLQEFLFALVAYAGVVIIATGGGKAFGPLNPLGLVCVLGSTVLYALYWIVNTRSKLPPTHCLFASFLIAGSLALVSLLLTGQSLHIPGFYPAIYVGLFELAIPFLLWGMALRLTTTVSRISTLPFLVPFLSLFWVSLILREPIAQTTLVGMVFIVVGTFLQQQAGKTKKQS